MMMEVIRSTKKSVLTRTTRRNIPEDGILQDFFLYNTTPRSVILFLRLESLFSTLLHRQKASSKPYHCTPSSKTHIWRHCIRIFSIEVWVSM
jgi:hypothetical protein